MLIYVISLKCLQTLHIAPRSMWIDVDDCFHTRSLSSWEGITSKRENEDILGRSVVSHVRESENNIKTSSNFDSSFSGALHSGFDYFDWFSSGFFGVKSPPPRVHTAAQAETEHRSMLQHVAACRSMSRHPVVTVVSAECQRKRLEWHILDLRILKFCLILLDLGWTAKSLMQIAHFEGFEHNMHTTYTRVFSTEMTWSVFDSVLET